MSWLSEIASSHRLQLGVTAIASGFLAASAVIGLQEARKWYDERDLMTSIPGLGPDVEKVLFPLRDALLNSADHHKLASRVRRCLA